MHRHFNQTFAFPILLSLLLVGSSLAYGQQYRVRIGQIAGNPSCPARSDERGCPPPDMISPNGLPKAPTFESMARERAIAQYNAQYNQSQGTNPAPADDNWFSPPVPVPPARPDAPDQSDLLKSSKDSAFILHNFKTMYVETGDIKYFGADQMKAALKKNAGFGRLNIDIVDDPRVADAVLVVNYTFAWDYPFELRHQNTTMVLLAGKGQGPFSGPLGAADVARVFVNLAKPWRTRPEPKPQPESEPKTQPEAKK